MHCSRYIKRDFKCAACKDISVHLKTKLANSKREKRHMCRVRKLYDVCVYGFNGCISFIILRWKLIAPSLCKNSYLKWWIVNLDFLDYKVYSEVNKKNVGYVEKPTTF